MDANRVYPQPNLGQGDQWARLIQADVTALIAADQKKNQRLQNLDRSQNATATTTASVYRELEAIQSSTTGTGEAAEDLANRITAVEAALGSLRQQQLPSTARTVAGSVSAVVGTQYPAKIEVEVPTGAHYAVLSVNARYSFTPSVSTTSQLGVRVNGVTDDFSSRTDFGTTARGNAPTFWAQVVQLDPAVPLLTIEAHLYMSAAATVITWLSAHIEFQY